MWWTQRCVNQPIDSYCYLMPLDHPLIRILLELQQAWVTGWLMLCGLNCSSGAIDTESQIFTQSPVDTRRVTSSMTAPGDTSGEQILCSSFINIIWETWVQYSSICWHRYFFPKWLLVLSKCSELHRYTLQSSKCSHWMDVSVGRDLSMSKIFARALITNCHFFISNVSYKATNKTGRWVSEMSAGYQTHYSTSYMKSYTTA